MRRLKLREGPNRWFKALSRYFIFVLFRAMRPTTALREMHVALVGMAGSGKSGWFLVDRFTAVLPEYERGLGDCIDSSDLYATPLKLAGCANCSSFSAIAVKYITKRFIGEYDSSLGVFFFLGQFKFFVLSWQNQLLSILSDKAMIHRIFGV